MIAYILFALIVSCVCANTHLRCTGDGTNNLSCDKHYTRDTADIIVLAFFGVFILFICTLVVVVLCKNGVCKKDDKDSNVEDTYVSGN